MAETEETTTGDVAQDDSPSRGRLGGLMRKAKVAAFVLVLIAGELAVAYAYYGNPPAPQEVAVEEGGDPGDVLGGLLDPERTDEEQVEVPLGEFDVTVFQPLSKSTLRVSFTLGATVGRDDESELRDIMAENQRRFREQVLVTIRSSEITDLTDPILGLIKRKILDKTNKLLGRPLVQHIIISEFNYFEQ